jgi:hypothetical protein
MIWVKFSTSYLHSTLLNVCGIRKNRPRDFCDRPKRNCTAVCKRKHVCGLESEKRHGEDYVLCHGIYFRIHVCDLRFPPRCKWGRLYWNDDNYQSTPHYMPEERISFLKSYFTSVIFASHLVFSSMLHKRRRENILTCFLRGRVSVVKSRYDRVNRV